MSIKLTAADMPNEATRWIAEDCGIDVAMKLLSVFRGVSIYVPRCDKDLATLTIQDLPNDDLRLVAERCGIQVAAALIRAFQQSKVYIPRLNASEWARRFICKHYDGSNAHRLAVTLGVSERWVYKQLVGRERASKTAEETRVGNLLIRQLNLFTS